MEERTPLFIIIHLYIHVLKRKKRKKEMAKIRKLKNGHYHTLIYDYTDAGGKRHYKSITGDDRRTVAALAAVYMTEKDKAKREGAKVSMTVSEAVARYADEKKNELSPSTYREYRREAESGFGKFGAYDLFDVTETDVQTFVNEISGRLSPKTVRNKTGLLSAVFRRYRRGYAWNVDLPKRIKPDIRIPSEAEIKVIRAASKGTDMEVPIILGACCALRRSEICGLRWANVDLSKGIIKIDAAKVYDIDHKLVTKSTKTVAGKRIIKLFDDCQSLLSACKEEQGGASEYVTDLKPASITDHFETLQKRAGIKQPYRFHDLRHYFVSVALSLNIPKKYIADYVGHETENMIDNVYGHVMAEKQTEVQDVLQNYFSGIM